jgi:hypothetical protein
VRLILDGAVVRVRLDRKATSISLLVVIGVREDGQKVLLAVKNMGGETAEGRDRDPSQGLHPQMAAEMPGGGRQPGGSRRASLRLHPAAADRTIDLAA